MMGAAEVYEGATNEYERAGAAVGTALGVGLLSFLWFFVTAGALMVGLLLKKIFRRRGRADRATR